MFEHPLLRSRGDVEGGRGNGGATVGFETGSSYSGGCRKLSYYREVAPAIIHKLPIRIIDYEP